MGSVLLFDAVRMKEIEDSTVVSGLVDTDGRLLLERRDGQSIDAGSVFPGMNQILPALMNLMYPVGKIYMSVDNTDPGELFGGIWESWGSGRVPVGVDTAQSEFNMVEETGGAKSVTLTSRQSGLRGHNHTQNSHNHTQNSHNHTQNLHKHNFQYPANSGTEYGSLPHSNAFGNSLSIIAGNAVGAHYSIANVRATNQATTAVNQATTATNNPVDDEDALDAHTNLQPYITCYMWKRVA